MSVTQVVSGNRIRAARLAAGLTQNALARAVDTSERNIVRWENDQNVPRLKHIAAIAQATGRDIAFFIESAALVEEDEEDRVTRLRRIRAELVLHGRDDLADDLLRLARAWLGELPAAAGSSPSAPVPRPDPTGALALVSARNDNGTATRLESAAVPSTEGV